MSQDTSPETLLDDKGKAIANEERTPCEVYTRVMGYYRPTSMFNTGKKGEFDERVEFDEPKDLD